MRRISFTFFARVILLTASSVLGILSLSTHIQSQEFVFAASAIAAAMLAGLFRRDHGQHQRRPHVQ